MNEQHALAPIILLAEANASLRRWLSVLLVEAGYQVLEAGSGPDVLRHLRASARVDVVITNTHVGRMRGWEITQHTSKLRPGVPVVRLIDSRADAVPIYGLEPYAVIILQKPFTITELLDAVGTLLVRASDSLSRAHPVLRHA